MRTHCAGKPCRAGDRTVLLIDTDDTMAGAEKAVTVAKEMAGRGNRLRGVRLDSGDRVDLGRRLRDFFRREGLNDPDIFVSGGFDEFKIAACIPRWFYVVGTVQRGQSDMLGHANAISPPVSHARP